jgi:hypothetical protein
MDCSIIGLGFCMKIKGLKKPKEQHPSKQRNKQQHSLNKHVNWLLNQIFGPHLGMKNKYTHAVYGI